MPKLSDLKQAVQSVPVVFGNQTFTFNFYPARVNSEHDKELTRRLDAIREKLNKGEKVEDEDLEFNAQKLEMLLCKENPWDITDDDGKVCPLTVQFIIQEIGYYGIARILREITNQCDPNARAGLLSS